MTAVFDLIFQGITAGYNMLNGFAINVYGFSFSLWDFLIMLFVLSFVVPLVVAPDHSGSFSNISHQLYRSSERNDRKEQASKRDAYYSAKTDYYREQHKYYNAKINRYRDIAKRK